MAGLQDPSLDVVTMAGWSLANIGGPEALGPLSALVDHPDRRVGKLFADYAGRHLSRNDMEYVAVAQDKTRQRLRAVPPPGAAVSQHWTPADLAAYKAARAQTWAAEQAAVSPVQQARAQAVP